jgi:hypothetical protein
MWDAILAHREQIGVNRPDILDKIDSSMQRTLNDTL